jgi:lysozyme
MRTRIIAAGLTLSAAGFITLAVKEGYTDNAIIPVKGDVPTVGFGQTKGVKLGDTTTPVRALIRLQDEIDDYEDAVRTCANVPMYQKEYDLYVDMTYNIGAGAFCKSTMAKRLNAGDYKGACDAILLYKYANKHDCSIPNNKVCPGLWQRRLESHQKCLEAADGK